MEKNLGDIVFLIIFPILLTFIQLIIPQKTKPKYLLFGFIGLSILSVLGYLYLQGSVNIARSLIISVISVPIIFALIRFFIFPIIKKIIKLYELQELLGAVDWGRERSNNIDTYEAVNKIETSFSFMGFGFSKYLKTTKNKGSIEKKSDINYSLLWEKLKDICVKSPHQQIKILLMNPLALEIERYSKIIDKNDKRFPMVEDLYFGLDCIREIRKSFGETVQVKFYPNSLTYKPSFRLFFFNEYDFYVSFYQWGTSAAELPYLHIKQGERNFFHPFKNLFEYFWEHGEVADIDNMPFNITLRDLYTGEKNTLTRLKNYIQNQLPPHLNNIPFNKLRIAVAGIAGRDSAWTILNSVESDDYDCIIPVLIGAPSEFLSGTDYSLEANSLGDFRVRSNTIKDLKQAAESIHRGTQHQCFILNVVNISTGTQPWADLMKKTQNVWKFQTGDSLLDNAFGKPCISCHIYIHYIRAMFCNRLGITSMIGGDRIYHDNVVKLNQMSSVLDRISEIVKHDFDVNLILPLREVRDSRGLQRKLESHGINKVSDVDCYFSGQSIMSVQKYETLSDAVITEVNEKINGEMINLLRQTLFEYYGK